MEVVISADETVVAEAASAEEVRCFAEILFVVALLGRARRAAECRRPHAIAGRRIEKHRALNRVSRLRAVGESIAHPAELSFEQLIRDQISVLVKRLKVSRQIVMC